MWPDKTLLLHTDKLNFAHIDDVNLCRAFFIFQHKLPKYFGSYTATIILSYEFIVHKHATEKININQYSFYNGGNQFNCHCSCLMIKDPVFVMLGTFHRIRETIYLVNYGTSLAELIMFPSQSQQKVLCHTFSIQFPHMLVYPLHLTSNSTLNLQLLPYHFNFYSKFQTTNPVRHKDVHLT